MILAGFFQFFGIFFSLDSRWFQIMNSIHEFLFFHGWWWWRFLFWFWARVCHTHTSKYLKHPKRSEMNEWMKILSELREKNKRKKHSFNKRKIFSRKWKCIYVCDEINEKTKTLWHTQRTIFNECLLHFDKIFSRFFCFCFAGVNEWSFIMAWWWWWWSFSLCYWS